MVAAFLLAAAAAVSPAPAAPPSDAGEAITLMAAGDVTLGHHFETWTDEQVAKNGWSGDDVVRYAFRNIGEQTRAADLFVVNLEAPFTWRGERIEKNFTFRARPELAPVLVDGGVDVVSLANNHLFDFGADALVDTITAVRAHRIAAFGAGRNMVEARAPAIVERKGVKVAFLGYFFLGDRNIEPPEVYATDTKPGVAGCFQGDECIGRMVEEDVRAAAQVADVVVPFFHWGREAQNDVMPYQRTLARVAIDAGAKLVLGAHPHVVHGIEQYKGVPIVYSLGNFVFGGNWNPRDKTTIAVRATLDRRGVKQLDLLPMQYTNPPERIFQPRWLEGEEAAAVIERVAMLSAAFEETIPSLRRTVEIVDPEAPKTE